MEKIIYSLVSVKNIPGKLDLMLSGMKGIAGAGIYTVSFEEISAVVCDIDKANFTPNSSNAIEYAGVIEMLSQQFALLPVRFGSIMDSTESIIAVLRRNYDDIRQNLLKVENKFEFGLKIFCDSGKLKAELIEKSKYDEKASVISNPDSGINHSPPGSADTISNDSTTLENRPSIYREWVNKKLAEHRFEELLLHYVDTVIEQITGCLIRMHAVYKFNKMTTESIIVDAIFLLDKERKDDLIDAIGKIQIQYPGLTFMLTGPWPPYNFVDVAIK